jgi:hypothetical protein
MHTALSSFLADKYSMSVSSVILGDVLVGNGNEFLIMNFNLSVDN